ncbi:hypothetical protein C0995_001870 [Termitomyces sp. Mi166|nr:hypothetical protein C0995_001870 [Termitomyces sp. Mi166\
MVEYAGKSLATWSTASENINCITAQGPTANPLTNLLTAQVNTGISTATEAHMDTPQLASSLIGTVTSVGFSPDGKQIVSGSWDNSLQQFDGHTHWVTSVGFSPDGKQIVSGSQDKSVRVWDASTSAQLQQFDGHTHWVTSVGFSPDGKQIVSGSQDKSVRVWDASTSAQLQQFDGHTHWVTSVGFSPDGKQIVSGSDDNSVRVWSASLQDHSINVYDNLWTSTVDEKSSYVDPSTHSDWIVLPV